MKEVRKNKNQLIKDNPWTLIRDRSFLVGLGVFVVLVLAGAFILFRYNHPSATNTNVASVNKKVAVSQKPVVTKKLSIRKSRPASKKTIIARSMQKDNQNTKTKAQPKLPVKELANTSGYVYYTVQPNDNFWTIAKLMCGNGRDNLEIQSYNGYQNRTLHTGDVLNIVCE